MRILIIESDPDVAARPARELASVGAEVESAGDGTSGLRRALQGDFQVVVLERDCQGAPAGRVCEALLAAETPPCVLMPAAGSVNDRIGCLNLGADDCLLRPFSPE